MPVIGFLGVTDPSSLPERLVSFRRGLNEEGFIEGKNLSIEYRWAGGHYDRFAELAADLVHHQVAVIAAPGPPAIAIAAKSATTTVPIVFAVAQDPVTLGLVVSLSRPGGNATGINMFTAELTAKRLGLLRELLPSATRVAALINPGDPGETQLAEKELECKAMLSKPLQARALTMRLQRLGASDRTRSLWRQMLFSPDVGSSLLSWRQSMGFPRLIRRAIIQKLVV